MIPPFKVFMPETVKDSLLKTIFSGWIGEGERVIEFEQNISEKFNLKNVVSLNSGTSALRMALALVGVGPGDEVISTPYTMVATNMAILEQFAKPVFADVQFDTININPHDIEKRITNKTKAIMCVHWAGYPCDMDEIIAIGSKYNLPVIEDAAHALGASYKGKPIGTISDFTAFSFQAVKHLTTVDGGMLSVKDKSKFKEAQRRRWFGIDRANRGDDLVKDPFGDISESGFKYQMNDVDATIGIEQLKHIDYILDYHNKIAKIYTDNLAEIEEVNLLRRDSDRTNSNWMFAIHSHDRNELLNYLRSVGVGAVVHNRRNDKYSVFGGLRKDLPNLDRVDKT